MARKLTPEEAEEYTRNLGSVAVGNFGLMEMARDTLKVPEALNLTFDEWVTDRLGGFVQRSVEKRREAVRELSGERNEKGRYERSEGDVAEILGISKQTVGRDREVLEAMEEAARPQKQPAIAKKGAARPQTKLSPEEKREAMRRLIGKGKSNAEIAIEVGVDISTVGKVRTALNKEKAKATQPSSALRKAQSEKTAARKAIPEADRKAREAQFEQFVADVKKSFAQAAGVYLMPFLTEVRQELQRVMDNDLDIPDYDEVTELAAEIVTELWVYGAKRGDDVSHITQMCFRLRGEDQ